MSRTSELSAGLEPTVETIELVCDRLADLGLAVGPDTARDLVRLILAAEAPRLDARMRDALATALETIRTATQSALGMLAATAAASAVASAVSKPPAHLPTAAAASPAAPPAQPLPSAPPFDSRRPIARRGPPKGEHDTPPRPDESDPNESAARPVFKRPRGR